MLIAKSAQRLPSPPGPGWPGRTSRASTAPALYEFISHVILHFLPTRTIDSRIRGLTCLRRVLPSVAFADNSTALSDKQNLSFFLFFSPASWLSLLSLLLRSGYSLLCTGGIKHHRRDFEFSPCRVVKGRPSAAVLTSGKSCITLGNYIPSLSPLPYNLTFFPSCNCEWVIKYVSAELVEWFTSRLQG